MSLRMLTGVFVGVCVLVLFATTPVARAYVQGGDALIGKSLDGIASSRPPTSQSNWNKARLRPVEQPWSNRRPGNAPMGEDPSAPIPEPGTLTLASLGLFALGAAMRRRRGTHAAAKSAVPSQIPATHS